ncbi:unnamed protein product [Cuscuta epithymum]|uniref:Uncharacterized protein n=1 Tax=Cuscuta epithymum TaxID=186058 RepID=A0AAV0FPP5_9ASTE|nr:unnamed protein product [Cuscuta epithymum]CAH9137401.1 unnamed protein product [Cuscuta epithymum]
MSSFLAQPRQSVDNGVVRWWRQRRRTPAAVSSLEGTISIVLGEESPRNVMLEKPSAMKGSALVKRWENQNKNKDGQPMSVATENSRKENRDTLCCTYCKKPRHIRENCWKLNGKPPSSEWGTSGELEGDSKDLKLISWNN